MPSERHPGTLSGKSRALPARFVGAAVLAALGCGSGTDTPVVVDPAGDTVVENREPAWTDDEAWTVAVEPRLSLGVLEGDEAFQFHDIGAAARRADGALVVADAGTRTVRIFGPDGDFRNLIGTAGSGPGEFHHPTQVLITADDAITVWDDAVRRITRFDAEGELLGTEAVSLPGIITTVSGKAERWSEDPSRPTLFPGPALLLSNEELLIRLVAKSVAEKKGEKAGVASEPAGRARRPSGALRVAPDLSVIDTVMFFGDAEEVKVEAPWGMQTMVPPLARNTSIAVQPNEPRICIGEQNGPEVRCFDAEGSALAMRWRADPIPVRGDDPEIEAWREETIAAYGLKISRDDVEALIARVPLPVERPDYSALVLDREGNLWVKRGPGREARTDDYLVFGRTGKLLGSVTTPALRVLEIGSDYILGVYRDELEVQYLQLYEIVKPEGVPAAS